MALTNKDKPKTFLKKSISNMNLADSLLSTDKPLKFKPIIT